MVKQTTIWLYGYKVKYFKQMNASTRIIPDFHVILTGQTISETMVFIQGDLQGQKVNFKVK